MAKWHNRSRLPPSVKMFRAASWYQFTRSDEYIPHLLRELGRLYMEISEIEDHSRAPHTQTVLSDLLQWRANLLGEPYAKLSDWRWLDTQHLAKRLQEDRDAKPRIELSAEITKMRNLSVRWHPGGWSEAVIDHGRPDYSYSNRITHRRWKQPPDFRWFEGDEDATWESRPSNELMYLRGVGSLHPKPTKEQWCGYNQDMVHSILICAVRVAYEKLIDQLERNFEVTIMNGFDFTIREEVGENEWSSVRRVEAWTLEDMPTLSARRAQQDRDEQDRKERAELENFTATYGITPEQVIDALLRSSVPKRGGAMPSLEELNRIAAKGLRSGGARIDGGVVRRLRTLLEHHRPNTVPASLIVPKHVQPSKTLERTNVVHFPKSNE